MPQGSRIQLISITDTLQEKLQKIEDHDLQIYDKKEQTNLSLYEGFCITTRRRNDIIFAVVSCPVQVQKRNKKYYQGATHVMGNQQYDIN